MAGTRAINNKKQYKLIDIKADNFRSKFTSLFQTILDVSSDHHNVIECRSTQKCHNFAHNCSFFLDDICPIVIG